MQCGDALADLACRVEFSSGVRTLVCPDCATGFMVKVATREVIPELGFVSLAALEDYQFVLEK